MKLIGILSSCLELSRWHSGAFIYDAREVLDIARSRRPLRSEDNSALADRGDRVARGGIALCGRRCQDASLILIPSYFRRTWIDEPVPCCLTDGEPRREGGAAPAGASPKDTPDRAHSSGREILRVHAADDLRTIPLSTRQRSDPCRVCALEM